MSINYFVFLVGNETPGNAGSIARIMANFDFKNLVLIDKQWYDQSEALMMAHTKEGLEIFNNHTEFSTLEDAIKNFNINKTIGFTRRSGKFREISFNLKDYFKTSLKKNFYLLNNNEIELNIALVFGRESTGLYSEEIELCDLLIYIPTSSNSPSLNLSHAVGIVLYEIFNIINFELKNNRSEPLSGMIWSVEQMFQPSTDLDREKFYNEIYKAAKTKNLFVRNDLRTFKSLFERIFNSPTISKRDLDLLKKVLMRFIFAEKVDKYEEKKC